ncbi:MAG: hypothetical protein AAB336_01475 [Acidobacteriota bacterium]
MKKLYGLLISVSFIITFSAVDVFAQKGGKGRYRKVALKKDAKKNGYKVDEQSRQQYFLQILGAEDPLKKRVLSGEELVEYKCRKILEILEKRILFENGNSRLIKIECAEVDLIVKPRILLLDEPE